MIRKIFEEEEKEGLEEEEGKGRQT